MVTILTACDVMDDFENNLSASLNFLFLLSTLVFVVLATNVRANGFKNNFPPKNTETSNSY